ncbi:hypothetical protein GQ457_01G026360 [Hibiscus cannabinus]
MDLEVRSLQPGVKATLLAKLREYKADLNKLKKEFKRISSPNANQAAHDELLASRMVDVNSEMLNSAIKYNEAMQEEDELLPEKLAIANVGRHQEAFRGTCL